MNKKIFKIAVPVVAVLLATGIFLNRTETGENLGRVGGLSQKKAAELPAPTAQNDAFRLNIYFDGGKKSYEVKTDGRENLFNRMKKELAREKVKFAYRRYPGLGVMINQIGDNKNGDGGRYWQFWVNGKFSAVGAGEYIVKPGDAVEWKFVK